MSDCRDKTFQEKCIQCDTDADADANDQDDYNISSYTSCRRVKTNSTSDQILC